MSYKFNLNTSQTQHFIYPPSINFMIGEDSKTCELMFSVNKAVDFFA